MSVCCKILYKQVLDVCKRQWQYCWFSKLFYVKVEVITASILVYMIYNKSLNIISTILRNLSKSCISRFKRHSRKIHSFNIFMFYIEKLFIKEKKVLENVFLIINKKKALMLNYFFLICLSITRWSKCFNLKVCGYFYFILNQIPKMVMALF